MRPTTGIHPAVDYPPVAVRPREAVAQDGARRALLLRLLIALGAVGMLLLLWSPAVVRAQGRPGPAPVPAARPAPAPSLAAQTAGKSDAQPRPAPPAGAAMVTPTVPLPAAQPSAPPVTDGAAIDEPPLGVGLLELRSVADSRTGADKVPFGGALVTGSIESRGDETGRLALRPQVGRELVPRTARGIGLVDGVQRTAARQPTEVHTVFHRDLPDPVEAERRMRALLAPNTPASRDGEFRAAPYAVPGSQLARTPVVGTGVPITEGGPLPKRYRVDDEVPLYLPAGTSVAVGAQLAPVTAVAVLSGQQRVVVPTGVIEVVRVAKGRARGVVRSQTGAIVDGQVMLPLVGEAAPWQPAAPAEGPELRSGVRWVEEAGRLLPPQGFVILDVGTRQGVLPGDRFALFHRGGNGEPEGEAVAVVRVVRADAASSTAKVSYLHAVAAPDALVARRIARSAPADAAVP